ncbi:MAG: hypothetical protein HY240_05855 [Actinobacteria bacterium]|nr:hypothetical protein [Actinomycetota bacterium]
MNRGELFAGVTQPLTQVADAGPLVGGGCCGTAGGVGEAGTAGDVAVDVGPGGRLADEPGGGAGGRDTQDASSMSTAARIGANLPPRDLHRSSTQDEHTDAPVPW